MIDFDMAVALGQILTLIVEGLKMLFPKVNPRYFSVGICVLASVLFFIGLIVYGEEKVMGAFVKAVSTAGLVLAFGTGLYKLIGNRKDSDINY